MKKQVPDHGGIVLPLNLLDSTSSFHDCNLSITNFSNDATMGLVLSAAVGTGWTTPSEIEGPSVPTAGSAISTLPWSLFTKSPCRQMRITFTCNVNGQHTTRTINPHAYTDGTIFVQVPWRGGSTMRRSPFTLFKWDQVDGSKMHKGDKACMSMVAMRGQRVAKVVMKGR